MEKYVILKFNKHIMTMLYFIITDVQDDYQMKACVFTLLLLTKTLARGRVADEKQRTETKTAV